MKRVVFILFFLVYFLKVYSQGRNIYFVKNNDTVKSLFLKHSSWTLEIKDGSAPKEILDTIVDVTIYYDFYEEKYDPENIVSGVYCLNGEIALNEVKLSDRKERKIIEFETKKSGVPNYIAHPYPILVSTENIKGKTIKEIKIFTVNKPAIFNSNSGSSSFGKSIQMVLYRVDSLNHIEPINLLYRDYIETVNHTKNKYLTFNFSSENLIIPYNENFLIVLYFPNGHIYLRASDRYADNRFQRIIYRYERDSYGKVINYWFEEWNASMKVGKPSEMIRLKMVLED